MKRLIINNLNGKRILILFIMTSIIYTIMLTVSIPEVMSYSGGLDLLDMMPVGYDAIYVNQLLNSLGEEGRHAYLYNQIPWDMVYPLLFGITYCLILAYFFKKLDKLESPLFNLSYLPLFAGLFDYFENIGIVLMLNAYPGNLDILSKISNIFSLLKSLTTTIALTILLVLLVFWGTLNVLEKFRTPGK